MAILTGIKKAKMFLTTPISILGMRVGRCMSKFVGSNSRKNTKEASPVENEQLPPSDPRPVWVPHPHSGIYFPKGQERVMEDIPNQAASLDQNFRLRNTDGVDDDEPQHPES